MGKNASETKSDNLDDGRAVWERPALRRLAANEASTGRPLTRPGDGSEEQNSNS
jgi:hypothetical protein